ncbi:hypothetical protein KC19_2G248100 [Ceratodon purpureus]|uniref:Uncharacterized protein n=1 Tax=Ceratodon purpureus TaxID=3225 RepID=A0A8T0J0G3_CERPU|nr:hypothetical protein KC19_2G248100 [Ceratodon purpureus]
MYYCCSPASRLKDFDARGQLCGRCQRKVAVVHAVRSGVYITCCAFNVEAAVCIRVCVRGGGRPATGLRPACPRFHVQQDSVFQTSLRCETRNPLIFSGLV